MKVPVPPLLVVIGCNVAKVVVARLANYSGLSLFCLPQGSQSSEFGSHTLEPVHVEDAERTRYKLILLQILLTWIFSSSSKRYPQ
jgi:hypothetical protein